MLTENLKIQGCENLSLPARTFDSVEASTVIRCSRALLIKSQEGLERQ
jgi:hypothetical protein